MKNVWALGVAILLTVQLSAQVWQSDLNTAKHIAQNKGINIVLVFSGSDWCAACIKLERKIWSSDEFQRLAENHFVLLRADFPRKKQNRLPEIQQQKNERLAEQYNRQGNFPLVVLLDQQGKVLGRTGYKRATPRQYFQHLTSLMP